MCTPVTAVGRARRARVRTTDHSPSQRGRQGRWVSRMAGADVLGRLASLFHHLDVVCSIMISSDPVMCRTQTKSHYATSVDDDDRRRNGI